jgi:hypothetical protein
MPLAPDQQAMLQLMLERGQSYADLASVLGVDEPEVRTRARAALTELAGADPDRNVGLTDYLLGQADPIGRADAVRHLKDDPEDLALATVLAQKLRLVAPQATLPRLPGEERRPGPRRASRASIGRLPVPKRLRRGPAAEGTPETAPSGPSTTLSRRQTQLIVGFGSAAVLVVVIILAATGAFGGSSGNGTTSTTSTTANPVSVPLRSASGGNASGTVTFGLDSARQPVADVKVRNLDPPPPNQAYLLWLLLTDTQGFPLPTIITPSKDGSYQNRVSIPTAALAILTRLRFVDVSVAPTSAIQAAIKKGVRNNQIIIQKPGTTVLQGRVGRAGVTAG